MQTYRDKDFMDRLRDRADESKAKGESQITTGKTGEHAVMKFTANGVQCVQLPDDEQGILRISIGGGQDTPVNYPIDYCSFRGDIGKCIAQLEKCLIAMKSSP